MKLRYETELYHYGTKGMHWHERLYQNKDGSLTPLGKARYSKAGLTAAGAVRLAGNYGRIAKDEYIAPGMRRARSQVGQARRDIRAFRNGGIMGVQAQRAFDRSMPQMYRKSRQTPGTQRMMSRPEIKDFASRFYKGYDEGVREGADRRYLNRQDIYAGPWGLSSTDDRYEKYSTDLGRSVNTLTRDTSSARKVAADEMMKEGSKHAKDSSDYRKARDQVGFAIGTELGKEATNRVNRQHWDEARLGPRSEGYKWQTKTTTYEQKHSPDRRDRYLMGAARRWEKENPGLAKRMSYEDYLAQRRKEYRRNN